MSNLYQIRVIRPIIVIFWPRYSIPREWKNCAMQYKKVQKSSWNEPYSSSSFTKQSCSEIALIVSLNQNGETLKWKADFSVVARLISKLATEFIIIIFLNTPYSKDP